MFEFNQQQNKKVETLEQVRIVHVQCTMYNVQCTLYTVQLTFKLYTVIQ